MATVIDREDVVLEDGEEFVDVDNFSPEQEKESVADELEQEISSPEIEVPAKFKGKSAAEIAKAYQELEKELGRKGNEIGELRKLTDEILKSNLQINSAGEKPAQKKRVEVDDLLEDPETAILNAIESSPRLKQLEESITSRTRAENKAKFEKQHPDYMDVMQEEGFGKFLAENPMIAKEFQRANVEYDYDAGSNIFDLYKKMHSSKVKQAQEVQKANRDKALKDATVESGSSGASSKKIFSRAAVLKLMRTNPGKYYSDDFQQELQKAYQEGRVR